MSKVTLYEAHRLRSFGGPSERLRPNGGPREKDHSVAATVVLGCGHFSPPTLHRGTAHHHSTAPPPSPEHRLERGT